MEFLFWGSFFLRTNTISTILCEMYIVTKVIPSRYSRWTLLPECYHLNIWDGFYHQSDTISIFEMESNQRLPGDCSPGDFAQRPPGDCSAGTFFLNAARWIFWLANLPEGLQIWYYLTHPKETLWVIIVPTCPPRFSVKMSPKWSSWLPPLSYRQYDARISIMG